MCVLDSVFIISNMLLEIKLYIKIEFKVNYY